ncbi:MAG: putative negative regulator of RcsB-dependent stress response [Cognaticolwellia sp.]|jgi:predicted negative regulator of RcsB-dependent stress response
MDDAWDPALASPLTAAAVEDPLPILLHLYAAQDFTGMRSLALQEEYRLGNSGESAPKVRYMAALARMELNERADAQEELQLLANDFRQTDVGQMAALALADSWLDVAPRLGVVQYQGFIERYPDSPYGSYAAQRAAYGLASEGQFSMALSQLEGAGVVPSPELLAMLAQPPEWKRPMVATFLSGALPGAGQLYAGQKKEAFSALFINALFIGGSIYAARNEQWATLGVLGFFGLGFYTGNIYGAADAAIRHNRGIRDDILEQMESEGMGPGHPLLPEVAPAEVVPAAAEPAQ